MELRHGRVGMHTRAAVWIEILVATRVDDVILVIRATCTAHHARRPEHPDLRDLGAFLVFRSSMPSTMRCL